MGVMRFLVHPAEQLADWPEVHRAFISGLDGRVFPTRVEVEGNVVSCRRHSSESGKLHVSWPVPDFGSPMISTCSLPERELPYVLAVELARGKIAQLRDQVATWEIAGMQIPEEFRKFSREAHRCFAQSTAIQDRPEEATRLACAALTAACRAADLVTQIYTRQRLAVRRKKSPRLPASLGCFLGPAVPSEEESQRFIEAFSAAAIPIEWRNVEPTEGEYHWETFDEQVEWCQANKLLIYGGPLLDLSAEGLPQWLWQWEHDFFNLQSFVCDFVETAISRYVGKIRLWEVAARVNTGGAMTMSEENRLTLVARTLETAGQVDEENQLILRIDQPWGDYQARGHHRLSPLQFVDALVRSGVGLGGVNLEIGIGFRLRGSISRDLLDFSRLIDHWSMLGIPLYVTLAFPTSAGPDENASHDIEVDTESWKSPWNEASQAEWVEQLIPLLLAKQAVVGIYWTHFNDRSPHLFPNAGLIDVSGQPKAALEHLVKYHRKYWQSADE